MRLVQITVLIVVLLGINLATAASDKPNVLFIAVDDLRPELGSYASPQAMTPNIDQLAARSLVFDRAYCTVPVCGASRASLLTGMLPTPRRFRSYLTRADRDAPNATTLPAVFKQAGYTTISNGKVFHVQQDSEAESWSEPAWRPEAGMWTSRDPQTMANLSKRKRGFIAESPNVEDEAYHDGQVAIRTIKDLQRLKEQNEPFFLACGFLRPHLPFYVPKKYWDLYERDQIIIANNRQRPQNAPKKLRGSGEFRSYYLGDYDLNSEAWHKLMRHGYLASTSYADKLIGDVLAELDRLDLSDNTIVVLWGDHGWHLGEHNFWGKHNTMHLSTRIPLIIHVPDKSAGRTSALVETSDIYPTLCRLVGLDVPDTVQGRSFNRLFEQPNQAFREAAYSRYGNADAVITRRFNYTRFRNGGEMLYDLKNDPQENVNVIAEPAYADTVQRMRALLDQRLEEAAP